MPKPWEDFKKDTYSIPGVSEVSHREEPIRKKGTGLGVNNKTLIVLLILVLVVIALIARFVL